MNPKNKRKTTSITQQIVQTTDNKDNLKSSKKKAYYV